MLKCERKNEERSKEIGISMLSVYSVKIFFLFEYLDCMNF